MSADSLFLLRRHIAVVHGHIHLQAWTDRPIVVISYGMVPFRGWVFKQILLDVTVPVVVIRMDMSAIRYVFKMWVQTCCRMGHHALAQAAPHTQVLIFQKGYLQPQLLHTLLEVE